MKTKVILPILVVSFMGLTYASLRILGPNNSVKFSTFITKPQDSHQEPTNTEVKTFNLSEFTQLLSITDSVELDTQLTSFLKKEMQTNSTEILSAIADIKNSETKRLIYQITLLAWHEMNPNALSQWMTTQTAHPDLDMALISLIELQNLNESTKVRYAETLSEELLKENYLEIIIQDWALTEPKNAIFWALKQQATDKWINQIFQTVSAHSLDIAISLLSYLEGASADYLIIAVQSIIDNFNPDAVNDEIFLAIQELTPYQIKEELLGVIFPLLLLSESVSLNDLDALIDNMMPGTFKDMLYRNLSLNWAESRSPQEAAEYAESLTGESREIAIEAAVSSWLSDDLEATSDWLSRVDGNIDMAANTLGHGSAQLGNIQLTDKWLNTIKNKEMRTQALVDVVAFWYNDDPSTGIYHLVHQKNLSTEKKLDLLHQIYPEESFTDPFEALDELGRLENLRSAF